MIVKPKTINEEKQRFDKLSSLMYQNYIVSVPKHRRPQGWIWQAAENKVKSLAQTGGVQFDKAIFLVKQSWVSSDDFTQATNFLTK